MPEPYRLEIGASIPQRDAMVESILRQLNLVEPVINIEGLNDVDEFSGGRNAVLIDLVSGDHYIGIDILKSRTLSIGWAFYGLHGRCDLPAPMLERYRAEFQPYTAKLAKYGQYYILNHITKPELLEFLDFLTGDKNGLGTDVPTCK